MINCHHTGVKQDLQSLRLILIVLQMVEDLNMDKWNKG